MDDIEAFLDEKLEKAKMYDFGKKLFGKESILGRMFFYSLSNEEFDLLHAAFLMEYGDKECAYKLIRFWNGENAVIIGRILEMSQHMELFRAIDCAKAFTSAQAMEFAENFFSEHPFRQILAYYHFSGESRKSMSGKTIQPHRDLLMMKIKDYMCKHLQDQSAIEMIVGKASEE